MKVLRLAICFTIIFQPVLLSAQVHLSEGFESGSRPAGWTEEAVSGNEPWRYRNGGHSPNDNNWQVPADEVDITRNPPSAYEGTYNAIFFKQGDNNERTKLITPPMDLLGTAALELSFYLCQIPWTFEGTTSWDVLRVYYKVSETDPWVLLHEYLDPVYDWEEMTLNLPNPSESYYVAFEGHTRWGYGTCIDNVTITETGTQDLYIGEIDFQQPFSNFTPSGSPDVPMMRIDFKVLGNTGSAIVNDIDFTSLNTDDADVESNGLKLYATTTQTFSTNNPVGSPSDFVAGVASFTGLNHSLPAGLSYLWLTYDVDLAAGHEDVLDVMVAANAISADGQNYPATAQSPVGNRLVYETRYHEDFEAAHNWALTGEFEVAAPNGMGGPPGNSNPSEAVSGTMALGTDLTGLGANPYHYEPDLNDVSSYTATSPNIDVTYYKNLYLFFWRYMNIEVWDESSIEISTDDGASWSPLWESSSYLSDFQWEQYQLSISDEYSRTDQFKIRYVLGPTDGFNNYTGWNIDDVYLTGEFISRDVGVSEWIAPLSGSGHTSSDTVKVRISNFGGAEIVDPVPVAYSLNGGASWTLDYMDQNIPVGGSVIFAFPTTADLTTPGLMPSVLAKTALPGDQFLGNDQIETELYIVPTYVPPYREDFESGEGFWRSMGNTLWAFGSPGGSVIDTAWSGLNSWATGLTAQYGDLISEQGSIIFEDNFEMDKGWTFTGEFERAQPPNTNLPYFAYSGYYCIGTDLSGQGITPYFYENGISEGSAYTATSPAFDVTDYSNLKINFAGWITIENGDSIRLEVSADNGASWTPLWKNLQGEIKEINFELREYPVPDVLSYSDQFRVRFSMYHSSSAGPVAEGWNIDDFVLSGDLVDGSQAHLTSPSFDLSGMDDPVFEARLWVETEQDVDGAMLSYSLDDGETWIPITNTSGFDSYWNWYTGQPVQALGMDGWSGQSGQYMRVRHLLPAGVLNQENVQFRFSFAADKVQNNFDGLAVDDIQVMEAAKDVDMVDILSPDDACDLSETETFTLRMRNTGLSALEAGDSIEIGYYVERDGDIQTAQETFILTSAWGAGVTSDFTMTTPFDFSTAGNYFTEVYLMFDDPWYYHSLTSDTVSRTIVVNKPDVDLGGDISTVRPDTVLLKAYSGVPGQTYLWQDSSTDSVFQVSTDGTYYVTVTNGLGCTASDTVQVLQLVKDVGVTAYLGPASACELADQLPLEVTVENLGTDTVEIGETIYIGGIINGTDTFEDALLLTQRFFPGNTFNHTYAGSFDFSPPGVYQMKLYTRLTDDFTASNDTLEHTLEVYGYPYADLGPDTVVVAAEYVLDPAPGYFQYLWQDGSTDETFTINQPSTGLYHVTVSDEHGCSDTDSVVVTLNVFDLALDQLLSPATSCELSENITISLRILNAGDQAIPSGDTIAFGYSIDGGAVVGDSLILSAQLLSGHTLDFTFPNTENVVTGQWYDFTVFVAYDGDSKSWNDTITTSVGVFETPLLDLGDDFQLITAFEHTLRAGPGFVSYEWQDGSTDSTFTITEPGTGVYSVTVTDVNGCTVSDEVTVMLAVPDVGILEISHPLTACRLDSVEYLQVAVQNFGNFDIDPTADIQVRYSINGEPEVSESLVLEDTMKAGEVIYHTFAQAEDFSQPGIYNLLVYTYFPPDLVASNNTVFATVNHYGSPQVDIGMGSDTMLVYAPITLYATAGYPSYLWQDGSTNNYYDIPDPSASWYKVVVTGSNGCITEDSVYAAYDVPDMAMRNLVAPVSSCGLDANTLLSIEIENNGYWRISATDTFTITYSINGGGSFLENVHLANDLPPGQSTILTYSGGYDFSTPGPYQVQTGLIWSPDQNSANNILITNITAYDSPDVEIGGGEDTLAVSLPVTLDAGTGFSSYLWQDNSTGSTFQASTPGWYWVIVSNAYACIDTDSVYVTTPTSTDQIRTSSGEIRIYPNPVKDILRVALDLQVEKGVELELYSMSGSLVYREDIKQAGVSEALIDVQNMTPGTYYLRILTDEIPYNFLVIVE